MSRVQTDILWPTFEESSGAMVALPLPYIDYSGAPINTTIQAAPDSGAITRRARYVYKVDSLRVKWHFGTEEYEHFKDFYQDTLGNGTACFELELRYPLNTELKDWVVRFLGGYEATWIDGQWEVTGTLSLVVPSDLTDQAPLVGFSNFMVQAEDSGEDAELFTLADGDVFTVITI